MHDDIQAEIQRMKGTLSSVEVLRSLLPEDTLVVDGDQEINIPSRIDPNIRVTTPPPTSKTIEKIESLSEEASSHKSTILSRLQHSLQQLHDMREHFESLLKDENIEELQQMSIQLQKVTKTLFTQLNQVIDERDGLADRADMLKASLQHKDQELIKVMKREEIQVRKLRESSYQQKRLQEKRDEIIAFLYEKAEEFELTIPELRTLYQSISVFYEPDKIKPVELHGKTGIKTQMSEIEYRRIFPDDSAPPPTARLMNIVVDFSLLRDQKTIDTVRKQIEKDSIWHFRTTELRERSMNDLLKELDKYYSRDSAPPAPDFKGSLQIRKGDINREELEKLWEVKIDPNRNISFEKTKYNINRIINELYAAKNGNTPQDAEIRERNTKQLKELRDMIMKSLIRLDPESQQLSLNIADDIRVLRENCEEIKKALKAFMEDYEAFKKESWKDFVKIRNATNEAFKALQDRINQLSMENSRLQQENSNLRSMVNGSGSGNGELNMNNMNNNAAGFNQNNYQNGFNSNSYESSLPPIDQPLQSSNLHTTLHSKKQDHIHKHCNHTHHDHMPMNRPCCNQVIPRYFKGLSRGRSGGESKHGLNHVDVSLWFQEPVESRPTVSRRGDRGLLSRSTFF